MRKTHSLTPASKDRLQAILLRQQGKTYAEIAQELSVHPTTVREWWERYQADGPDALDRERRQHKRHEALDAVEIQRLLNLPGLHRDDAKKLLMLLSLAQAPSLAAAAEAAGVSQQYLMKVRRQFLSGKIPNTITSSQSPACFSESRLRTPTVAAYPAG